MSACWFCIPSKRPPEDAERVLELWRERGYKIALVTDDQAWRNVDLQVISVTYQGYARSVNYLAERILSPNWAGQPGNDPDCDWICCGGDDTEPDLNHTADEIAAQLTEHFKGTFGVMQPTGDRFAGGSIDRICGSPWMGREFCERMYQGNGPLWPEYRHCFVDNELQEVSIRLGVLWQRRDLSHYHHHFTRHGDDARATAPPDFLREANSPEHWQKYGGIFGNRKRLGFPGHEPLALTAKSLAPDLLWQ
jgi:hypothetical protein